MVEMSPAALARVAHACEDYAGCWYGPQPSGLNFSRWDCERYVTEGHLAGLFSPARGGRYTFDQVWKAVAAHLDAHPEILAAGRVSDSERDARQAIRRDAAAALIDRAGAAFSAGDLDEAERLLDDAELACPGYGQFDRGRAAIARARLTRLDVKADTSRTKGE